jgi:hypothetical protein
MNDNLINNADHYSRALMVYNGGKSCHDWESKNHPDQDLIYKNGLYSELKQFTAISNIVNFKLDEPKIVAKHSSKSVELPVPAYSMDYFSHAKAIVFMRDNFHDIKMSVVSNCNISLPYEEVHSEVSPEQWAEKLARAKNYCGDQYTEEQYASGEWYKTWCHNTILLRDGVMFKAYGVQKVYCEGINRIGILPNEVFHVYETNKNMFSVSVGSYAKAALILEHISNSLGRTTMYVSNPDVERK